MPAVPVHDVVIHPRENDLVVGTHGRGFFIADISPLQEMTKETLGRASHLFNIEPKVRWRAPVSPASSSQNYRGESEPRGIPINYYLGTEPNEVTVRVYAGARLIKELEGKTEAGLNQVMWDMTGKRPRTPAEKEAFQRRRQGGGGGGGGGGFQRPGGQQQPQDPDFIDVAMPPGEYRVVLEVDGNIQERVAQIWRDHWFKP
jgi:hypothetical protein